MRYWLVLGGTGSVWDGTCWFLVVLGQKKEVLVSIWGYWVSLGWYRLVLGGTGSVGGGTGWCLLVLGQ